MPERTPGMDGEARPRLAPGVRLHWDEQRRAWLLLAPERILALEGPAAEILRLCNGQHSVAEIAEALAQSYRADVAAIRTDVEEMLAALRDKRMVLQ